MFSLHKSDLFSCTVSLKIGARSLKPYQVFILPQFYIHATLVLICLLVHEISCTHERATVTPTPMGLVHETICPTLLWCGFVCFCCFTSQVNSYGHCGTVSSPKHTFSWAGLNKRLTSNSCTYFRLLLTTTLLE